jgi:hypothetical protein
VPDRRGADVLDAARAFRADLVGGECTEGQAECGGHIDALTNGQQAGQRGALRPR